MLLTPLYFGSAVIVRSLQADLDDLDNLKFVAILGVFMALLKLLSEALWLLLTTFVTCFGKENWLLGEDFAVPVAED